MMPPESTAGETDKVMNSHHLEDLSNMKTGCFINISVFLGTEVSDQKWDYCTSTTFVVCIFILANHSITIPKNETPLKRSADAVGCDSSTQGGHRKG
jgi:hypothetical protein